MSSTYRDLSEDLEGATMQGQAESKTFEVRFADLLASGIEARDLYLLSGAEAMLADADIDAAKREALGRVLAAAVGAVTQLEVADRFTRARAEERRRPQRFSPDPSQYASAG
jgi:hypothetical protein